MKKYIDILIKGANVINPQKKIIEKTDIAVYSGKFVEYNPNENYVIKDEIDAQNYYLSPGWIDAHTHIFSNGTESGLPADTVLIPMGVTAAVDGGSCGCETQKTFKQNIVDRSTLNIYYSINVSPAGQITERYPENVSPQNYDVKKLKKIFREDSEHIRGLKLRYGAEVVADFGNDVLDKVIELANELSCPITLHVANPPCSMEEIVSKMRAGDVVCHIYQGKRSTIIDESGNVKEAVFKARERGVFFDSADARINHSYAVIKAALEQNFKPDIISTDLTYASMFRNMCWGLPVVLSKWLNMGMSLQKVIKACTYNPARIYNLNNGLGTLNTGADANITIFKVVDREFKLKNRMNEEFSGTRLIVPQCTIIKGEIMYRSVEFPF